MQFSPLQFLPSSQRTPRTRAAIRDRCRTDVGGQKLIRLVDLLKYGNSVGKSFGLEIKDPAITDAQAKQLWNAIKNSRVQLAAASGRLAALNKIKTLDAADPTHIFA